MSCDLVLIDRFINASDRDTVREAVLPAPALIVILLLLVIVLD